MGRIRTIKPEMARHGLLFDTEKETGLPIRFVWAMLPTACCREGRFKWRPRELKVDLLPYDEVDFSRVLDALLTRGFIVKYRVGFEWYGCIPTFLKHQVINNREQASDLPDISIADEVLSHASSTREARDEHAGQGEGKGKEGKGRSICTEPQAASAPPVLSIVLNSKALHPITQQDVDDWQALFPAVNVLQELRKMVAWADANPKKRKTKNGIRKFVVAWLSKEQDRGHNTPAVAEPVKSGPYIPTAEDEPYLAALRREGIDV